MLAAPASGTDQDPSCSRASATLSCAPASEIRALRWTVPMGSTGMVCSRLASAESSSGRYAGASSYAGLTIYRACALRPSGVEQRPHVDLGRAHDAREPFAALALGEQAGEPACRGLCRGPSAVHVQARRQRWRARLAGIVRFVLELEPVRPDPSDLPDPGPVQPYLPSAVNAYRHCALLHFGYGLSGRS